MEVYKIGYVNNDCTRIKYKKVLITLLLLATVKTNIDRSNIIDKKYAKYRCNKAYVKDIIDNNNKSYNIATSGFYHEKLIYEKNKMIETSFDEDIEEVCSGGIHFFLDRETALNYKENILYQSWKNEPNVYKNFYGNGQICKIINYTLDNPKDKSIKQTIIYKNIKEYYENGQIKLDYNLSINKYDGLYIEWFENGQMKKKLRYDKNKVVSYIHSWDVRGIKH